MNEKWIKKKKQWWIEYICMSIKKKNKRWKRYLVIVLFASNIKYNYLRMRVDTYTLTHNRKNIHQKRNEIEWIIKKKTNLFAIFFASDKIMKRDENLYSMRKKKILHKRICCEKNKWRKIIINYD